MNAEHNPGQHKRSKATHPGPGSRLKAARVKVGLDVAELAAQLRLRRQVIEDLENNSYDNLPPPVFVQGYYRNMADALGLAQDEIVQAYFQAIKHSQNELTPEPTNPGLTETKTETAPAKKTGFLGRLGGLGQHKDGQQASDAESETQAQDLSRPRIAPKARLSFSPKTETSSEMASEPASTPEPRAKARVEPVLDTGRDADPASGYQDEYGQDARTRTDQSQRSGQRQEPKMASRTEPAPRARRLEPEYDAQDQDGMDTEPRSFRPGRAKRTISFSLPKLALPQWRPRNLGLWLRRMGMTGLVLAVLGLAIWGLSLIPAKSIWNDVSHKLAALTGSSDQQPQQAQNLPPQVTEPEALSIPTQPSTDTQLLEPPELGSLTDIGASGLTPSLETEAEPTPKAPGGHHKIIVELKGVSWVEIEDATKEYRLVGELQKGSVHELKGTPPYRMLFGRGNLVKVTVDGKNYDFSKHQQGSVARFTLAP